MPPDRDVTPLALFPFPSWPAEDIGAATASVYHHVSHPDSMTFWGMVFQRSHDS